MQQKEHFSTKLSCTKVKPRTEFLREKTQTYISRDTRVWLWRRFENHSTLYVSLDQQYFDAKIEKCSFNTTVVFLIQEMML